MDIPMVVKKRTSRPPFQQYHLVALEEFECAHCKKTKKSNNVAVKDGNWDEVYCNGCTGELLSKACTE